MAHLIFLQFSSKVLSSSNTAPWHPSMLIVGCYPSSSNSCSTWNASSFSWFEQWTVLLSRTISQIVIWVTVRSPRDSHIAQSICIPGIFHDTKCDNLCWKVVLLMTSLLRDANSVRQLLHFLQCFSEDEFNCILKIKGDSSFSTTSGGLCCQ